MSRTYRDPIHKEIQLDSEDKAENLIIALIDTKEMQRLRWIRQLGTGWFTFHGAEASRFPHSLGTMHVARLMFEKLTKEVDLEPALKEEYKALVLSSALLHDLGHAPFSHSSEAINNIKHEIWTEKIIASPETEVNQVLESFEPGFSQKVISVLKKTYPVKFLSSIVNSQLDCDRFDYLLRDSFHTGTAYGNFDLTRVINSITVNPLYDCLVVSGEKGMLAVEDYLYARYSMYMQVYQHKKCLASDSLLLKLFKRVKLLIRNRRIAFIETPVFDWVSQPEKLSLNNFLQLDDTLIIHHIKRWANEQDVVLKDLAKRFMSRKIFKAEKIAKDASIEDVQAEKSKELIKLNLDPDYYLDTVSIASKPYSFYNPDSSDYQKAIFVATDEGKLEEISKISHVVKSLVSNEFTSTWLIYADLDLSNLSSSSSSATRFNNISRVTPI
ncbi:MAG: hypothetical protein RLZZ361_155 [Cyanobacteriota bacterium]|jgi:HD superfamily phosphohydrolase